MNLFIYYTHIIYSQSMFVILAYSTQFTSDVVYYYIFYTTNKFTYIINYHKNY